MTIRTKATGPACGPRPAPGRRCAAPVRTAAAPHVAVAATDLSGILGAPSAHRACAGEVRRTPPACRPGRAPGGATTWTAGASLPRGTGLPARGLPTGPEGERTTGEGA